MDRCLQLLAKAQRNPEGMRFRELRELAECFGFELARVRGSHHLFKRAGRQGVLNFQKSNGMAKAYQVRQLLSALDDLAPS